MATDSDATETLVTTWRLPSIRIEAIVIHEITTQLSDQTWLVETARHVHPDQNWSIPERIKMVAAARSFGNRLASLDTVARDAMIEVSVNWGCGRFSASSMAPERERNQSAAARDPDPTSPSWRRNEARARQGRCGSIETRPYADPRFGAGRWMTELVDGTQGTVTDLAAAYGTDVNYVARHLPLAHLSTGLIDAILDARQPVELTTWDLLNRIDMPLD